MILKIGDSGAEVKTMQMGLARLGWPLRGTGYFGSATFVALKEFQKRKGLKQDGVYGPESQRAMQSTTPPDFQTEAGQTTKTEINRPLWLQAGLRWLGTKERPGSGNNSVIIDWAKEEGGNIAKTYTHDSIPWCALFTNTMLTEAGLPGTESLWALDFAGKWPSINLQEPAVGAFAPMVRNGGGHIICIVGRFGNGLIAGLGGNQGDAVTIAGFPMSRLNKGFWWPASVPRPRATGFNSLPIVGTSGKVSSNER